MLDFIKNKVGIDRLKKGLLSSYGSDRFYDYILGAVHVLRRQERKTDAIRIFEYIASNTVCMSDEDIKRANKLLKIWREFDVASCEKYKKDLKNRVDKILGCVKFEYIREFSKNCKNYISKSRDFPADGDCTRIIDEYSNIDSIEMTNRYVLNENDCTDSILLLAISNLIYPACNMAKAIKENMKCGEQFDKTLKEIESKIGVRISGKKSGAEDIFQQLHDKKFTLKKVVEIINDVFLIFKRFKFISSCSLKKDNGRCQIERAPIFMPENTSKEENLNKLKTANLQHYQDHRFNQLRNFAETGTKIYPKYKKYVVEVFRYIASEKPGLGNARRANAEGLKQIWYTSDKPSYDKYKKELEKNLMMF